MTRRVAAWLLVVMLLVSWPTAGVQAQGRPNDTSPVVGGGAGLYLQAAAPSVVGAFDRAISELDAAPPNASPKEVSDLSFRRRILELRLLMDFNSFAYDRGDMRPYREMVDHAYEAIGVYQDIADFEKELGAPVPTQVVAQRQAEMNEALVPLRNGTTRGQLRQFLATPLRTLRQGGGPGLWDITGSSPSNAFDAVGNAAEFQSGIIRNLQNSDIGVTDIFDESQALHFHEIRKQMRNVVILSAMYPPISDNTREAVAALTELVGDYGDTLEAYNSYVFAQQVGMDTEKAAAETRREFERAQMIKDQFIANGALDTMARRLNEVRDAHRR
jgi:hypothetical protein